MKAPEQDVSSVQRAAAPEEGLLGRLRKRFARRFRVSEHLCFTPAEFQSLTSACQPLPASRHLRTFQNSLVEVLQAKDPSLASRVASFREPQMRVLVGHFKRAKVLEKESAAAEPVPVSAICALSFQEWRVLSQ